MFVRFRRLNGQQIQSKQNWHCAYDWYDWQQLMDYPTIALPHDRCNLHYRANAQWRPWTISPFYYPSFSTKTFGKSSSSTRHTWPDPRHSTRYYLSSTDSICIPPCGQARPSQNHPRWWFSIQLPCLWSLLSLSKAWKPHRLWTYNRSLRGCKLRRVSQMFYSHVTCFRTEVTTLTTSG